MAQVEELDWLKHSVGVIALRERAIISISGDDAVDWLQGQISNQVQGVVAGDSVYGFVLTLKGRILADVYALIREDDIWLDVPASQVAALMERLDRYIIMEDVDLEHRTDLRVISGLGPRAEELSDGGWPADRLGLGGRQWVVSESSLEGELETLTARARELGGGPLGDPSWNAAHPILGRPRFGIDFGDWTYPQESGLNPLAVSFNKGCYIGQETVVMLENRGKAPKVLWRWEIDGGQPPTAKSPIALGEAVVGEITSSTEIGDEVYALGFLKRGHEAADPQGFAISGNRARALGPVSEGPSVASPRT